MAKKKHTISRLKIRVLFFSGFLLFFTALRALNPDIAVTQYVLDTWTVDDGLPQNTVTCMTQTHDGYIWLGTGNGLTRFDGSSFTVFNTSNTEKMIGHDIRILFEDSRRNLWVGTMKGLNRLRNGRLEDFPGREKFSHGSINNILEDGQHNLWIRPENALFRFKNGRLECVSDHEALAGRKIQDLCLNKKKRLLISTDAGLFRCEKDKIERVDKPGELKKEPIRRLFSDKDGVLWMYTDNGLTCSGENGHNHFTGTGGFRLNCVNQDSSGDLWLGTEFGLKRLKNGRIEPVESRNGPADCEIKKLVNDRDGNLWIATVQGLYRYRRGQFARLTKKNGLTDDDILFIFEDRQGNLWVGTKRGLSRLKNPRLLTYSSEEGVYCDAIRSILQDSRGNMWFFGDSLGLTRFKERVAPAADDVTKRYSAKEKSSQENKISTHSSSRGQFTIFSKQTGCPGFTMGGALYEDSSGNLWVGPTIIKFKGKRLERFTISDDRDVNSSLTTIEDQPGRFWFGTKNGLLLYKPSAPEGRRLTTFTIKDGLTNNYICELVKARDGTLWIGTLKGVTLYKDGTFYPVRAREGPDRFQVNDIVQDSEGTMWLGTYGGLYRYRDERFFRYAGRDGLPDDAVLGILEDDKGNLWMSSNRGIFYAAKKTLHDFAAGRITSLHPLTFDRNDGMKSEECNGGCQPTCWKDRDGRLWFSTMKGAVVVDPDNLKLHTKTPPVYIEKIVLDGKRVNLDDIITVPPGTKRIEFHYAAVNFTNPGSVRFRCRLAGHDKRYIEQEPGRERIAYYMNVPGGTYRFRVTASSSDGAWDMGSGAGIDVKIIAAYYETWWFKAVVLLVFASVSYLVFNFFKKYFYLFAFWKRTNYIGQYVIIEPIGSGGMATVFKARHMLKKKKIVAIKVLKREFTSRPLTKKRFKQEGVIVDKLEHPHIIRIFERGEQEDSFYLVMELLEGQTLSEKIKQEKGLNIAAFLEIMEQLMDVLSELHGRHIIHRDLKPSNIMLIKHDGRENFVKLLDFGLARAYYDTRITESGSLLGTLPYISPEQITRSVFSPAGDIYASGVIAYEMVTGSLPFADCSELEIMQMKLDKEPVEPVELRPGLPPFIDRLIMEMIGKDPQARPTAEEIREKIKVLDDRLIKPGR